MFKFSKKEYKPKFKDLRDVEPSTLDLQYAREIEQYNPDNEHTELFVAPHINDSNREIVENNLETDQPVDMIPPEYEDEEGSCGPTYEDSIKEVEACTYLFANQETKERVLHKGKPIAKHSSSISSLNNTEPIRKKTKISPIRYLRDLRKKIIRKTASSVTYELQKKFDDPYFKEAKLSFKVKNWVIFRVYCICASLPGKDGSND